MSANGRERRVRLIADSDAPNPRDDDNFGIMVCGHRRYNLGDVQLKDGRVAFAGRSTEEQIDEAEHIVPEGAEVMPLYLIDHSGIAMRTRSFSDCDPGEWDSGQVGIIYVTRERIIEEWKDDGPEARAKARECLESEVETYSYYLEGDAYGFIIEHKEPCDCERCEDHWIEDRSCWGFLGPIEESGVLDYIPEELHEAAKRADMEYP